MEIRRPAETDGGAIAALVIGILAFALMPIAWLLGPIAMFLGISAKNRIRDSNGALSGAGLAQAGWILGTVAFALGVLTIAVWLALARVVNGHGPTVIQVQRAQPVSVQARP